MVQEANQEYGSSWAFHLYFALVIDMRVNSFNAQSQRMGKKASTLGFEIF